MFEVVDRMKILKHDENMDCQDQQAKTSVHLHLVHTVLEY